MVELEDYSPVGGTVGNSNASVPVRDNPMGVQLTHCSSVVRAAVVSVEA